MFTPNDDNFCRASSSGFAATTGPRNPREIISTGLLQLLTAEVGTSHRCAAMQ
jgi:hypothetical protein